MEEKTSRYGGYEAANMLSKPLWTADKGWSYSLLVGRGEQQISIVKET
jgi:hypothetical protein